MDDFGAAIALPGKRPIAAAFDGPEIRPQGIVCRRT
jgi:hypothetical protein